MVENAKYSVEFDPSLMEAVVTRALAQHVAGPAGFSERAFHDEADPVYATKDESQRSARFRALYATWFRRGQFDQPVLEALAELPEVAAQLVRVTVTSSASAAEERADLAMADDLPWPAADHATSPGEPAGHPVVGGHGGADSGSEPASTTPQVKHWLGICVQPGRFLDRPSLRRWLRHELWHIRDMLDPTFQYRREDLTAGTAERLPQRVVQDRYALLWSLSIDARVERAGLLPLRSREERLDKIAAFFPGISAEGHRELLDSIGTCRALSHPKILELARNPRGLCDEPEPSGSVGTPLRGSACPLCHFPTFHWADLSQPRAAPVIEAIRSAYPDWDRQLGACSTCFDLFSIRGGIWA